MPVRKAALRKNAVAMLILSLILAPFVALGLTAAPALADNRLVVVAGDFQSEIGCDSDWQASCEASQLLPSGSPGIYTADFTVPQGQWEFKVALDGTWDESYGLDGGDTNISLGLAAPTPIRFIFDENISQVGIDVLNLAGEYEPSDDALVSQPVSQPGSQEQFYFVLTDRFADGDPSNNTGGIAGGVSDHGYDPTNARYYHGGDIAGLIDKLDYIEGLGTTAIWLTPAFENLAVQAVGTPDESAGYHGYWITDFEQIDPHLGGNSALADLIAAAHDRGLKVYFDIITNHTADVIEYAQASEDYIPIADAPYQDADGVEFDPADYAGTGDFPELDPATSFPYTPNARAGMETIKNPSWLNDVTLYHNRGNSTWAGESVTYGDFFGLDDLMTEHPDVVAGFIDVYKYWIDQGVDGFRIDTVKHVNFEFWQEWTEAILDYAHNTANKPDFFMFGEVYDADARLLAPYVRDTDMNSVLDFAFQSSAVNFARGATTQGLAGLFAADDYYTTQTSSAGALPTFLGNHDMGRVAAFIEGAGNELERTKLAHDLMFLTRGQPVVYYGDEQGIIGTTDDIGARQSLFASQTGQYQDTWTLHGYQLGNEDRYATDVPMYEHIAELAQLRSSTPALADGEQVELHATIGAGAYAFARVLPSELIEHVVVLNNSSDPVTQTFTTLTPDAQYTSIWGTHDAVTASSTGEITVTVPALSGIVLKADRQVGTPADADITLNPGAGAKLEGLTPVSAEVADDAWAQTSFAYRVVGSDDWHSLGTATGDAPRVFHDVSGHPVGTLIEYRGIYEDADGNRIADSTFGSVGQALDLTMPEPGPGLEFVTVPGNHNIAMGCVGDWAPDCEAAQLTLQPNGLYSATFDLPAGTYEYKVALGGSWDVNYGTGGTVDGTNDVYTHAGGPITFYYNPITHHFINTAQSPIVTLPGDFVEALGGANWAPEDMTTWMGVPDSNGIYTFKTAAIPAGSYEVKVAHGLSWDENYGVDGAPGGDNYSFDVSGDQLVVFRYDSASHILTITEEDIPVAGEGVLGAYWIDETTIAWPTSLGAPAATASWTLHHAPTGGMALVGGSVTGATDEVTLTPIPGGLTIGQRDRFRHLSGHVALRVEGASRVQIEEWLTGQVLVLQRDSADLPAAFTGLQIPGVLDDLYADQAGAKELGVVWEGEVPTLTLWAPTAKDVTLQLYDDALAQGGHTSVPMTRAADGTWSVVGDASWKDRAFKYAVQVYVPAEGGVVTNEVTDPYSVGLTVDSTHSVLLDPADPTWEPAGWQASPRPTVRWVDQTIYELHVRDFSISDETVPAELRGTYAAFTVDSDGTRHLQSLADAGMTTIHLLPTFDISTIPEDRADQTEPVIPAAGPASQEQQAAVEAARAEDGFNWGYDPFHYNTPEGSYASPGNQHGGDRLREYRSMVDSIHQMGMQVIVDKVYNHTSASGQNPKSVLDKVVPGYYHRLNAVGEVEKSTCCDNIATEHQMAQKVMVDSVVYWAKNFKIDGFRFDLMGHHSLDNMLAVRAALDELTVANDGIDGQGIYLYGEGWNFGEVANNARFHQASQGQLGGTGIGTFTDRLRDAVRGGAAFDTNKRSHQGFGNGLATDPNDAAAGSTAEQYARLAHQTDLVRLGLAGNLRDFEFLTSGGSVLRGDQIDYNGQPAGYADSPEEIISYVDKHDNETLFDINTFKLPVSATMDDRVRMNHLAMATAALSQTPWFMHAGSDLLRSKSLDRNSYDSGDHFNRVDWSKQDNNFGVGLPLGGEGQSDVWPQMVPLLENPALKPAPADIAYSGELVNQLVQLRFATPLLRLGNAELINQKVSFPESGPDATPGLITMLIDDLVGDDIDPLHDAAMVVFNASPSDITEELAALVGRDFELVDIQVNGVDDVVKATTWAADSGTLMIPARSVAVLVEKTVVYEPEVTTDSPVVAGEDLTVTGTGFAPGESVEVTLDGEVLGTVTADDEGAFEEAFTVDAATEPGTYDLVATGAVSEVPAELEVEVVAAPVVYEPTVSTDGPVTAGESLTVTGSGFAPGESVEVTLDGEVLGTVTADDEGNFEEAFVIAEDTAPGTYELVASGAASGATAEAEVEVTEAPVVYEPMVSTDGPVTAGESLTVTGSGFEPGESVEVTLGGEVLGTVTADDEGNFEEAFVIAEDTVPGTYDLVATGAVSEVPAEADVEVVAAPVVYEPTVATNAPVEAGQELVVTGSGFAPGESVEVTLDGEVLGTVTADDEGNFEEAFVIAEDTAPGTYELVASGAASGATADAQVIVSEAAEVVDPVIEVADSVDAGELLAVSGSGFTPGEAIEITLDGIVLGTVTADDEGGFEGSFLVSADTVPGTYELVATGSESSGSATAMVAVTEPVVVEPTPEPTPDPTVDPTPDPTPDPTVDPTVDPTPDPTPDPTVDPTVDPTPDPTPDPTVDPTVDPTDSVVPQDPDPSSSAPGGSGQVPATGAAVGTAIAVTAILLIAGIAVFVFRRRSE